MFTLCYTLCLDRCSQLEYYCKKVLIVSFVCILQASTLLRNFLKNVKLNPQESIVLIPFPILEEISHHLILCSKLDLVML